MRAWLSALAYPKRNAAIMFTTRPMKVRTFGLTRARASRWTMASSRTPQARPKALVQVLGPDRLVPVLLGVVVVELILIFLVRSLSPIMLPLSCCRFVVNRA